MESVRLDQRPRKAQMTPGRPQKFTRPVYFVRDDGFNIEYYPIDETPVQKEPSVEVQAGSESLTPVSNDSNKNTFRFEDPFADFDRDWFY
jgi:hypothetical protein